MGDFVSAAKVTDIPPGTKKAVDISGRRIMLVNADGNFFAMDDACSHKGCALTQDGLVDGQTITCSCHGSQFDLASGAVLAPPATIPMKIYKTKVEGEMVMIAL